MCCVLGGEEVDEQIQLRDDVIFQLKQETSTQQQRIEELKDEIEDLRTQASIKKESVYIISVPLFTYVCVCITMYSCRGLRG